jgi:hypothetical protein
MKNCALALFAVFCIIFCSGALYAQQRGGSSGGQPDTPRPGFINEQFVSTEFDKSPFDMAARNLPPAYIGHDPRAVYDALNNIKEDALAGNYPLVGSLHPRSTYAFQARPTETFYDSRERTLRVYVELKTILANKTENRTKRGFMVWYEPQMDSRYTYTDARGKKIEIEQVGFREYTIAFEYPAAFPVERVVLPGIAVSMEKKSGKSNMEANLYDTLKQEVIPAGFSNVPSSKVAQLKESTRLLVLCNLIPPYTASTTIRRKGTIEKLGEYRAEHAYLYVRLLELWFYDVVTGKVIMKMKPAKTPYKP